MLDLVENEPEAKNELITMAVGYIDNAPDERSLFTRLASRFHREASTKLGVQRNSFQLSLIGERFKGNEEPATNLCVDYLKTIGYGFEVGLVEALQWMKNAPVKPDNAYIYRATSKLLEQAVGTEDDSLDQASQERKKLNINYLDTAIKPPRSL